MFDSGFLKQCGITDWYSTDKDSAKTLCMSHFIRLRTGHLVQCASMYELQLSEKEDGKS